MEFLSDRVRRSLSHCCSFDGCWASRRPCYADAFRGKALLGRRLRQIINRNSNWKKADRGITSNEREEKGWPHGEIAFRGSAGVKSGPFLSVVLEFPLSVARDRVFAAFYSDIAFCTHVDYDSLPRFSTFRSEKISFSSILLCLPNSITFFGVQEYRGVTWNRMHLNAKNIFVGWKIIETKRVKLHRYSVEKISRHSSLF